MSIQFLLGVSSAPSRRRTTIPKWRSHEYERRKEPTREESLRQRIEIWRELDPEYARALEAVLKDRGG